MKLFRKMNFKQNHLTTKRYICIIDSGRERESERESRLYFELEMSDDVFRLKESRERLYAVLPGLKV